MVAVAGVVLQGGVGYPHAQPSSFLLGPAGYQRGFHLDCDQQLTLVCGCMDLSELLSTYNLSTNKFQVACKTHYTRPSLQGSSVHYKKDAETHQPTIHDTPSNKTRMQSAVKVISHIVYNCQKELRPLCCDQSGFSFPTKSH